MKKSKFNDEIPEDIKQENGNPKTERKQVIGPKAGACSVLETEQFAYTDEVIEKKTETTGEKQ